MMIIIIIWYDIIIDSLKWSKGVQYVKFTVYLFFLAKSLPNKVIHTIIDKMIIRSTLWAWDVGAVAHIKPESTSSSVSNSYDDQSEEADREEKHEQQHMR